MPSFANFLRVYAKSNKYKIDMPELMILYLIYAYKLSPPLVDEEIKEFADEYIDKIKLGKKEKHIETLIINSHSLYPKLLPDGTLPPLSSGICAFYGCRWKHDPTRKESKYKQLVDHIYREGGRFDSCDRKNHIDMVKEGEPYKHEYYTYKCNVKTCTVSSANLDHMKKHYEIMGIKPYFKEGTDISEYEMRDTCVHLMQTHRSIDIHHINRMENKVRDKLKKLISMIRSSQENGDDKISFRLFGASSHVEILGMHAKPRFIPTIGCYKCKRSIHVYHKSLDEEIVISI